VGEQRASQLPLRERRGLTRSQLGNPRHRGPAKHHPEQHHQRHAQLRKMLAAAERARDHGREQPRLSDDQQRADHPQRDGGADEHSGRVGVAQQARVYDAPPGRPGYPLLRHRRIADEEAAAHIMQNG